MTDLLLRPAVPDEFPSVAALIRRENDHAERRCIQSNTGTSADAVGSELARLHAGDELRTIAAWRGDALAGVIAAEVDEEGGRGWVRGPFVSDAADWDALAPRLLAGLRAALGPTIRCLDALLDEANVRGDALYDADGFLRQRRIHVYEARADGAPVQARTGTDPDVVPVDASSRDAFIRLHDAIFPRAFAGGERALRDLDDDQMIRVLRDDEGVAGYVFATLDHDEPCGVVEFLGVEPDRRGRGCGRRLLDAALRWAFVEKEMPSVALTVNEELANARSLYERAGFRLLYTGVHRRREESPASDSR